jgi:hydroxymethylpyrimidine/phosphomethylpyrimidine kinase
MASAVAAGLAHGYTLESAVDRAHAFVHEAIVQSVRMGRGRPILQTGHAVDG